jgi:amino acid adenylation domain-containing protein
MMTDGQPVQNIMTLPPTLKLPVVDLRTVPDEKAAARRLANEQAKPLFDLTQAPLVRAILVQIDEAQFKLFVTFHHIITDGFSLYNLFMPELITFYRAFSTGQSSPLPELPIQYADFASWQSQQTFEAQLSYWKTVLGNNPPRLQLPTDYPRPVNPTFRGAKQNLTLSQSLTAKIKQLNQQQGVSLFMTLLATFNTLLYRYTGQDDLIIGSFADCHNHSELENVMGYFINTLVLRTDMSGNPTFKQLLARAREVTLGAYSHHDLPFQQLVEVLNPTRHSIQNPFFEVALTLEPPVMSAFDSDLDWKLCQYDDGIDTGTAKFDLSVEFEKRSFDIIARLEYRTDLFAKATIERLIGHFQTLLEGIVANPLARISELPLLTERERHQLLVQWNNTQADYPKDKCLHQLFEAQVETTPEAVAVVFEEQQLTYRELNQNGNQLAHYLQTLGVKPEVLVGICVERSIAMVIGLLGILKAGGAYVPIDPSYPPARIRYMLDDSAAPVLLTQTHLKAQLSLDELEHECVVVCLDEADLASQPIENPLLNRFAKDLAYVIYTSGSTGRQKGAMIEHEGAVNLATFQHHYFHTNTDSKILQFASLSFDAATWEVLMSLCSGAALQLVPMSQIQTDLTNRLQKYLITHATLPPYAVNVLSNNNLSQLKYLIVAGEACSAALVRQWAQPGRHFINAYGPTEATVCASVFECLPNGNKPPIGQPIANTRIYILDKNNQPQPSCIPGELCIAGVGLARGYLNRPELTADKFVEVELFGKTERIYKTGDLAKWRPDGNLEYIGRLDHQVKLRGFRIELGEIEAVLSQHPAVHQAVVRLFDSDDNKRLVAYLTGDSEPNQLVAELKEQLKASLPDYMIPSHFTVLDRLPLTPNGKIDRQALPVPEIKTATRFAKPITPTEDLLACLWAGVLKRKTISRHDNFFELGGHSLLATQLIARIRDIFQVELPMRAVFEHPQLSRLATAIEATTGSVRLPPIEKQPAEAPKVLSFAQQRLWFLNQFEESNHATYNLPTAWQLSGHLDVEALQRSLHWLLERHASLRAYFPTQAGQAQLEFQAIDNMEVLTIHDLRVRPAEALRSEVQIRANRHAITPFDLAGGPLFKVDLLQLNDNHWVLLLNLHHIISDAWSMAVFIRDWQHAYTAFTQGGQPSLPPLLIQYSDYAAWQRQWLQRELLQQQVDYWHQQLAGSQELLELPTDKPRPPLQSYQGAHYSHRLSPTLTKKVTTLSRQQGVTVFMTLLTTFYILLSRYSRQPDLCVGTPIAGRTHSQTENLIGLFVNTLVLRSQVQPQQSFMDLLLETRHLCLEAYAHQDIPFEMLVEQLQPTRSLSHSPLFQVMFVLQNHEPAELTLPGLEITALAPDYPIAKFDLTLNIEERDGQWHCWWEYATDLFYAETIERMAGHFEVLLTAIVENPEQSISHLPMLTEKEVQQLLAWNDTAMAYPKEQTIVDLFEQQVEKTPDNIAVVFERQQLSYQQLNNKANQLAHYLLSLKTDNGSLRTDNGLIAIAVERSLEMLLGLLSILKAGGAYVPIDPSYPPARIRYLLDDSAAPLLLTQTHLKALLSLDELEHECVVVCLDEADLAEQSTENPAVSCQAEDLAYIIYTSGSTGKPKGVMVEHQALVLHCQAVLQQYTLNENDQILQFASFSFDTSLEQLLVAWLSGAGLVLVKTNLIAAQELLAFLKTHAITVADLPPAYWQQMLEIETLTLPTLRMLILGGEALPPGLAQQTREYFPALTVFNAYGPTEAVITPTCYCLPSILPDNTAYVAIGQPRANTRIYILDAQHQPQPIGIPGELCIAGRSLARGYLNRPELTAEKFVEVELFGKTERIYKTGDLAKWRADGNLEYLGRIDNQVKIRGFRIELGEIEATLTQHENVKEAVVILQTQEDNPRLVAYVTLAIPIDGVAGILRTWLRDRLPEYMLPASFTVLDQLPLTPNGQIDRKALSQLSVNSYQLSEKTLVAPRTSLEELLADIWACVLGIERIGVHDNFFELGGHSLQAVQLVSKIALATKIEISVKQLFLYPTLAQLATLLDKSAPKRNPIEPSPSTSQLENPPISKELIMSHSSAYFQLERRSLLSLLAAHKIPPVNAAALGYLPDSILEQSDLSREEILEQCFDNLPVAIGITETAWGRIALLLLPRFNSELYGDTDEIVEVTLEALEIAEQMGADTVSLTGIIPSATDYGRAISKAIASRPHLPQITTGHSTTSATVVLAIQKALQQGGRAMATERVGVIGLGSIGLSSLRLMLKCLPHPVELMLCDLYSRQEFLQNIREQLISELGFQGQIQLLFSEVELPNEIYNASLIIGATNVPEVLDINQVKSGTLIVDDSGPHCFKSSLAVKRFQAHQDILFTEGGVLKSPQPISQLIHLPHHLEKMLKSQQFDEIIKLIKHNPFEITGCVFSSVLSAAKNLKPLVGFVQLNDSVKHYNTLNSLGFQAADLHCEDYVLPYDAISHFRERFSAF